MIAPDLSIQFEYREWRSFLKKKWSIRRCFICQEFGFCQHRELEAESLPEFWNQLFTDTVNPCGPS